MVSVLVGGGLLLGACGDASDDSESSGDGAKAGSPDRDEGESFEANVAIDGGTVATESEGAVLEIPPGALPEATEITIHVEPSSDGTLSSVYRLEPDGLRFAEPIHVTVAFDGSAAPGLRAVIGRDTGDGKGFVPLPSAHVGDHVIAELPGFSRIAVVGARATACANVDPSGKGEAHGEIICELDEFGCGAESYDFECDAEQCRCIIDDQTVKSVPNPGICTGQDSDDLVLELADLSCGWNLYFDDDADIDGEPSGDGDGDGDGEGISCFGRCGGRSLDAPLGSCRCELSCEDASATIDCSLSGPGAEPDCECRREGELIECTGALTAQHLETCEESLRWCEGGCALPAGGGCMGFGECADGVSAAVECPTRTSEQGCTCMEGLTSVPCPAGVVAEVLACCAQTRSP